MFSKLASKLIGDIRSRRTRFEIALLGSGIASGLLATIILSNNREHLNAMLIQYVKLQEYEISNFADLSRGPISLVRDYALDNALLPLILLSLSVLLLVCFAISSLTKSNRHKVNPSSEAVKKPGETNRKVTVTAFTLLVLALIPGNIFQSAIGEAENAFAQVEQTKSQAWADAKTKQSQALTESLKAHSAKMDHDSTKMKAQMDCRSSASSTTYYSGNAYINGWVEPGYYDSCSLFKYLQKNDYKAQQQVTSADFVLSSEESASESTLRSLNFAKANSKTISIAQNVQFVFQMAVFLLGTVGLLAPILASAREMKNSQGTAVFKRASKPRQIRVPRRTKCPKCAEYVKSEAAICKHCGSNLHQSNSMKSE